MVDRRWQPFGHHDVIVKSYKVIIPRDIYQKIDFWTYHTTSKFHCYCLHILEVTVAECASPGLKRSQKARSA